MPFLGVVDLGIVSLPSGLRLVLHHLLLGMLLLLRCPAPMPLFERGHALSHRIQTPFILLHDHNKAVLGLGLDFSGCSDQDFSATTGVEL